MTRKQKTSAIVIAVVLLLSLVAATYAYFTASLVNNATNISVTTTELANLTMTSIKSEVTEPIYPGWVGYQGIEVKATGSGKAVYDLTLNVSADTNIASDILVSICKVENSSTALEVSDITYTAATAEVNTTANPVQYYMTGGVVTLPTTGCTPVVSNVTLASLGASKLISTAGGKEIVRTNADVYDKYYISYTYQNTASAQLQGETFTVTPSIAAKAEQEPQLMISCETVAGSGNYVACDASNMYVGERIKIGNDANAQYFRYIRTTDTTSNLNECATNYSLACLDTANNGTVGIPGEGYIRMLAEYNLNIAPNTYSGAPTGLQHEYVRGRVDQETYPNSYNSGSYYGTIAYGSSVQYSSSNVKTYVEEYVSTLASTYGISGLSGSTITYAEIQSLCDPIDAEEGTCAETYPWVYQTSYWSGSASPTFNVWHVDSDGRVDGDGSYGYGGYHGVRAVVQILASSI